MQFSDYFLDTFIAPELSKFTVAEIPDLSEIGDETHVWIRNYMLSTATGLASPDWAGRPLYYNFLRKTQGALGEYSLARRGTLRFLDARDLYTVYIDAINHWESTLSLAWQASCLFVTNPLVRNTKQKLKIFDTRDDSPFERLDCLYGRTKHIEKAVRTDGQMPDLGTLPVWLTNDGLKATDKLLTFAELAKILTDLAARADALQDPLTAREKLAILPQ